MSEYDESVEKLKMSPEEEQEVLETRQRTESQLEPADEGVGAHTDADDDPHTEN
jgi:hypothetical protein